MKFLIVNDMNDNYAKQICAWRYSGEYSIYNLPSFEEAKREKYSICNPQKRREFFCFLDSDNNVVAYSRFVQKSEGFVMGIGISPKLTGQGLGSKIILQSIEKLKEKFAKANVVLQVRSWNKRAIKCRIIKMTFFKKCNIKILNLFIVTTNHTLKQIYITLNSLIFTSSSHYYFFSCIIIFLYHYLSPSNLRISQNMSLFNELNLNLLGAQKNKLNYFFEFVFLNIICIIYY